MLYALHAKMTSVVQSQANCAGSESELLYVASIPATVSLLALVKILRTSDGNLAGISESSMRPWPCSGLFLVKVYSPSVRTQ